MRSVPSPKGTPGTCRRHLHTRSSNNSNSHNFYLSTRISQIDRWDCPLSGNQKYRGFPPIAATGRTIGFAAGRGKRTYERSVPTIYLRDTSWEIKVVTITVTSWCDFSPLLTYSSGALWHTWSFCNMMHISMEWCILTWNEVVYIIDMKTQPKHVCMCLCAIYMCVNSILLEFCQGYNRGATKEYHFTGNSRFSRIPRQTKRSRDQ